MGFIHRFLLPKEINFVAALLNQATTAQRMTRQLQVAASEGSLDALAHIDELARQASRQRRTNLQALLDVFITRWDKESIYRLIVALDWVALSIKHFQLEAEVYDVESLQEYQGIVDTLCAMADGLVKAIQQLADNNPSVLNQRIDQLREQYDSVVGDCARATASLLDRSSTSRSGTAQAWAVMLRQQTLFNQLKEIARRLHMSGDSLEDMALKIV